MSDLWIVIGYALWVGLLVAICLLALRSMPGKRIGAAWCLAILVSVCFASAIFAYSATSLLQAASPLFKLLALAS